MYIVFYLLHEEPCNVDVANKLLLLFQKFHTKTILRMVQEIIRNGWLRAGVTDTIKMGSTKLTTSITTSGMEGVSKVDIVSP